MACTDCTTTQSYADYAVYNPACLWCGARYFQRLKFWPPPLQIGDCRETKEERQAWRARVLAIWKAQGHDMAKLLNAAAADKAPFEPAGKRR